MSAIITSHQGVNLGSECLVNTVDTLLKMLAGACLHTCSHVCVCVCVCVVNICAHILSYMSGKHCGYVVEDACGSISASCSHKYASADAQIWR
jgi:hypothetical protein